jgi:hypothetical protein
MGTIKHESAGTITFKDEANQILASMTIGKVKKKPTDYVDGDIKKAGKICGKIYGSYMGFIEWDGVRYWDAREILPFMPKVFIVTLNFCLRLNHLIYYLIILSEKIESRC